MKLLDEKTWLGKPVTTSRCAVCVLEDVYSGAEAVGVSEQQKCEVLKQTISMLQREFSTAKMPSTYITEAHRILKQISGLDDPFKQARETCNTVGSRLTTKISKEAEKIEDDYERFRYLVIWAVAANTMDIRTAGAGYASTTNALHKRLKRIFNQGLAVDDTAEIFRMIPTAKRVLCVLDNVGEIAVDRLLLEELQRNGTTITAAVRGGPLTSDATKEDAVAVGFDSSNIRLITTGPDTLGMTFDEMSDEFRDEVRRADLILGKGQANFYAFCQYRNEFPKNVVALLRTKCNVINQLFDCSENISIAALI